MQAPIYPILWRGIREACFSWVPPLDPSTSVGATPAEMGDSLIAGTRDRLARYDRERLAMDDLRHAPPGRRRRFQGAAEFLQSRRLQTPEALQHLSYTHPYAHRPLVEFMLTIPAHIVCAPGQPRRLMRRSFAGLLPPAVLNRKSKASYNPIYRSALLPMANTLLKMPRKIEVVERGWVDPASLIGRLERFRQGLDCNENQLRQILLFEFWLRRGSDIPAPAEAAARPPALTAP
jgi:asparagine synthase (glutamine-hydrolysing)